MSMDKSTARVSCLQEKLSREAFNGSAVRLLNSKNILIANTEGTQVTLSIIACDCEPRSVCVCALCACVCVCDVCICVCVCVCVCCECGGGVGWL